MENLAVTKCFTLYKVERSTVHGIPCVLLIPTWHVAHVNIHLAAELHIKHRTAKVAAFSLVPMCNTADDHLHRRIYTTVPNHCQPAIIEINTFPQLIGVILSTTRWLTSSECDKVKTMVHKAQLNHSSVTNVVASCIWPHCIWSSNWLYPLFCCVGHLDVVLCRPVAFIMQHKFIDK